MSSLDDTITISSMSTDTITLDNTHIPYLTSSMLGPYYNVGTGGGGGSGSYVCSQNQYVISTNGTAGWGTINTNVGSGSSGSSLNVKGDAEFEGKVNINGQDLGEFMEAMSRRLAILVPDPEKLEHFEALKKAYEHYKMLEKLCELPKEEKE
jgi:hypothetical protein